MWMKLGYNRNWWTNRVEIREENLEELETWKSEKSREKEIWKRNSDFNLQFNQAYHKLKSRSYILREIKPNNKKNINYEKSNLTKSSLNKKLN